MILGMMQNVTLYCGVKCHLEKQWADIENDELILCEEELIPNLYMNPRQFIMFRSCIFFFSRKVRLKFPHFSHLKSTSSVVKYRSACWNALSQKILLQKKKL